MGGGGGDAVHGGLVEALSAVQPAVVIWEAPDGAKPDYRVHYEAARLLCVVIGSEAAAGAGARRAVVASEHGLELLLMLLSSGWDVLFKECAGALRLLLSATDESDAVRSKLLELDVRASIGTALASANIEAATVRLLEVLLDEHLQ